MRGVLLYGPPGSGKDTITAELHSGDGRYIAYERLKVGSGKSMGYRLVAPDYLRKLEHEGSVLYRNSRYGNVYAIDRTTIAQLMNAGAIPVIHIGQLEGIAAVEAFDADWLRVLLWCPKAVTARRVALRGDLDATDRLNAWDATYKDLVDHTDFEFDLFIPTDLVSIPDAAKAIRGFSSTASGRTAVSALHLDLV